MTRNPPYSMAEELEFVMRGVVRDREARVSRVPRDIATFVTRFRNGFYSLEDTKRKIRGQLLLPLANARGHRANALDTGIPAEDIDRALAEQHDLQVAAIAPLVEAALLSLES